MSNYLSNVEYPMSQLLLPLVEFIDAKFAESDDFRHTDDGTIEYIIESFFEEMKTPNLRNFVLDRIETLLTQSESSSSSSDSEDPFAEECNRKIECPDSSAEEDECC